MTDLAEFLLARIAEDEATARVEQIDVTTFDDLAHGERVFVPGGPVTNVERRVLAECEAKRRIVERHVLAPYRFESLGLTIPTCEGCGTLEEDAPCPDLRLLALPYADHPDWREAWRP